MADDTTLQAPSSSSRRALAGHVLPYLVWIAFILVFQLGDSLGLPFPRTWFAPAYAVKSVLVVILLAAFKPWRYYGRAGDAGTSPAETPSAFSCGRAVAVGLVGGAVVAILWILPEAPFFHAKFRLLSETYLRWLVMPLGAFPDYYAPQIFPILPEGHPSLCYSPAEAGWFLTVCKLLGSAFTIAVAEEFFFRGFLYRWIRNNDFTRIPLSRRDVASFWIVVALFAFEHDRFFMGAVAGIVYGLLAIRTGRLLPAVVAHVFTNLLLGLHVILSGQYGFW